MISDVVDISLPTHLHFETALAAIEAGKHVFCEKPFTITSDEAQQLLDAANSAGVVHYLNHNYRRCPAVALAKQLIDDGRLGRDLPLARGLPTKLGLSTQACRSTGNSRRRLLARVRIGTSVRTLSIWRNS